MKKYKKYMDDIGVSDMLHKQLMELCPPRRPVGWKKYGVAAAALVLVAGIGIWELSRLPLQGKELADRPELERADIAQAAPSDVVEPGMKTIDGYEVTDGEVVSYFMLPSIEYGVRKGEARTKDWALQEEAASRELTGAELAALLGGADTLSTHLAWGGYELSGTVWQREDGSFLLAFIDGYAGPLDHFKMSVMDGQLPPTCIAFAESVENELWGVIVTADKYDGKDGGDRRVSFMSDGMGYRFEITATDTNQAGALVSRFVRQMVVGDGLDLSALSAVGEQAAVSLQPEVSLDTGDDTSDFKVGEPNWLDGQ